MVINYKPLHTGKALRLTVFSQCPKSYWKSLTKLGCKPSFMNDWCLPWQGVPRWWAESGNYLQPPLAVLAAASGDYPQLLPVVSTRSQPPPPGEGVGGKRQAGASCRCRWLHWQWGADRYEQRPPIEAGGGFSSGQSQGMHVLPPVSALCIAYAQLI